MSCLSGLGSSVDKIDFNQLGVNETSMSFFDFLQENNFITPSGSIRKEMDEFVDGVNLCDRIRYALAFEESEYYDLIPEENRKEFLFHIF